MLSVITLIYLSLLLLAVVAGIWRWRMSDSATRIFTVVLAATFITEMAAVLLAKIYHNNPTLYRIWAPLEFSSYCLYLNYCVLQLQRRAIGWMAAVAGIITAIAFDRTLHKDTYGASFLMVESVLIICGCLYASFSMLLHENDEPPTRHVHFWLVASLLFFFCFSFLSVALYNGLDPSRKSTNTMLLQLINIGNIGMVIGVLYAYIRLPKLLPAS